MRIVQRRLSNTFKSFFDSEKSSGISKMAILLASLTAGTVGFLWLKLAGKLTKSDTDTDTMDFHATEA